MEKFSNNWPLWLILVAGLLVLIFIPSSKGADNLESGIMEPRAMEELTLTSSAFIHGDTIPKEYTCDGENTNPPLSVSGVPGGTQTLALIVDDPDIPESVKKARLIDKFDHWILFNIPVEEVVFESPYAGSGTHGKNTAGDLSYRGPCPPTEHEPTEHRYVFQLYALDTTLDLPAGASEAEVRRAMKGHILAKTELIGLFDRTK